MPFAPSTFILVGGCFFGALCFYELGVHGVFQGPPENVLNKRLIFNVIFAFILIVISLSLKSLTL